ncbi:MAG TPA: hypothetical protein VGN72_03255 [Tepidisphaeraceae bacterium]|nr:hypothetical protein [Tepidisphaeraceae bacterium]
MSNYKKTKQMMATIGAAMLSLAAVNVDRATAAYSLQYTFDDADGYVIASPGATTAVTVSLRETVSGADASILGTAGLTGAGVRLNWAGSALGVAGASSVTALSGLSKTVDLTSSGSVGYAGFAFDNVIPAATNNGNGSVSYTIPIARFVISGSTAGATTLSLSRYQPTGNYTFSDGTELDGVEALFASTTTITVVPEPSAIGLIVVSALFMLGHRNPKLRRHFTA